MGTPEYNVWSNMRYRCSNKNLPDYKNYGGRGIKVCDRWQKSFVDFVADMGKRPSLRHTIDRTNNDGNYEPSNCRWVLRSVNAKKSRRTLRTICVHGHPRVSKNLIVTPGKKQCRECKNAWNRAYIKRQQVA